MIIDTIENCGIYYGINERFEQGFDFIKKVCREKLPVGRYEIDGSNLYALVQEYNSKMPEDARFEAHKNYIDIQYIISGTEKMEAYEIASAVANTEYSSDNDVIFFDDCDVKTSGVFKDKCFAIFFPNDVHRPGMATDKGSETICKVVVKVKID